MRSMVSERNSKNRIAADGGFSLVEVLVCIALVALTCVPLFSGIRLSATLNNKAHNTQKVTAYAQEELETIKSISVEDYVEDFKNGVTDGGVTYTYITDDAELDEAKTRANELRGNLPAGVETGLTAEESAAIDAMFTPFICEKKDIDIGGRKYTMHAKFMPAEYSQYNEHDTAANVNVSGFYDVAQADAVRFPVISDEINLYDEISVSELLTKLAAEGETGLSDADILGNMKKTVLVTVKSPSSGGEASAQMSTRCDVTYTYPASGTTKAELSYCVYNADYELYPASGTEKGSESGGNAFIFARAFADETGFNQCVNELEIKSTGDTNIYFILGKKSGSDKFYNFSRITVNDEVYSENFFVKSGITPGERTIAGTNGKFLTNVKVNGKSFELDTKKTSETIGRSKYKTVGYAVEIEMFDQDDSDKRVAHVEATKIDK